MCIYVVIPVHNHVSETLRCIECLARQTYSPWACVVVDDGSTDGTADILGDRYPEVVVLRGDGNLWWAGATALAVDYVRKRAQRGDFVLFLNNDTEFKPDYLEKLVETSLQHARALTGSLGVASDDPSRIVHSGVWWDWQWAQSRRLPIEPDVDGSANVNTLPGRGTLVPIEVLDAIGNLNARRLPHYGADYEFACRAFRAGFKLAVAYRAVLRVRTDITGSEGDLATPVSARQVIHLLFSRRSIRNLRYRMTFIALACPARYRVRNWLAILAASALLITNVPPLFQMKNLLFRLLPAGLQRRLTARKIMALDMSGRTRSR